MVRIMSPLMSTWSNLASEPCLLMQEISLTNHVIIFPNDAHIYLSLFFFIMDKLGVGQCEICS